MIINLKKEQEERIQELEEKFPNIFLNNDIISSL